jgi:hypothetical protein
MERRNFLKLTGAGIVAAGTGVGLATCNSTKYLGWVPNVHVTNQFRRRNPRINFTNKAHSSVIGSGKGKVSLLWKHLERQMGEKLVSHDQQIGDCVGQSYALATDILTATRIGQMGYAETFVAKASVEAVYAGSRYEIGYEKHENPSMLIGDGSFGCFAAEFLRDYGVLLRQEYGNVDLRGYDPQRSREWGANGVPDELEPIARKHPVRDIALVESYEDVRDAMANGHPVAFCSSVGFEPTCNKCNPSGRDAQGFLNPCGTWYHAMTGIGCDDTGRAGVLIQNSWGPHWVTGAKRHGQPDGSFWVDASVIDKMCAEGDSFALSGYIGFPAKPVDYQIF